jgi:aldehyde dehydrogenase (NAD+)
MLRQQVNNTGQKTKPMSKHFLNYVDGVWCDSEQAIEVLNPADESLVGTIAQATTLDVDRAVGAARRCVESEALTNGKPVERARLLRRIAHELRGLMAEGVPLLVAENGKTTAGAVSEFENAIAYLEYYSGMADKIEGKSIPLGNDYVDFTYYEPLGVSAQIVPWNYPVDLCARSLAPALAAGNAVVIKSPELTPLSMTLVAKACELAGALKGSVNLICGYGHEAGAHLAAHHDIDQIVFTGSVATGRSILHAAAERALPCVMELGGKSAAVVFPDADLEQVMASVDWGIFSNAGQICSAMSRMLVHEDIYNEVVARATALAKSQVLGAGDDLNTTLTPVASDKQLKTVIELCEEGIAAGAKVETGGQVAKQSGYYIEPTIFSDVDRDNPLFQNEVFGPVLAITPFKTEEEAWQLANATDYGLVAGVFTKNLNIAMRASRKLKAGQVFVNEWFAGGIETPFGGMKLSGYGREKGQEALYNYVHTKNVAIKVS